MVWSDPDIETVRPGLHRVPLPLPGDALRAVNVYVLESPDGLTLIDAGWDGDDSWQALRTALGEIGAEPGDVCRVLVTHIHHDHFGLATALTRAAGAQMWLGQGEQRGLDKLVKGADATWRADYVERAGAHDLAAELRKSDSVIGPYDFDIPTWIDDGWSLTLPNAEVTAIATPGHTQGHISFIEPNERLFFSGDHVLPHITPSIGFEFYPSELALGHFLDSLAKVRNLSIDLVLPAHGPIFRDLSERVDELVEHHAVRLDQSGDAVSAGATTAYEVAKRLRWTRRLVAFSELNLFNRMLATWETLAHLNLLVSQQRLTKDEVEGVWIFGLVSA